MAEQERLARERMRTPSPQLPGTPRDTQIPVNYISNIKIFYLGESTPVAVSELNLAPLPPSSMIEGFLCRGGREVAGVTQAWLWQESQVSRKTINDFENGLIQPRSRLVLRLRQALESAGVTFVAGPGFRGVVCYLSQSHHKQPGSSSP